MKILIVYAHPWEGSFNHAILNSITTGVNSIDREYEIIDLNKDNFNPVFTKEELALYNKGESIDPLIKKYQELISLTEHIIFIFPTWWGGVPAILKGFIDKVFLKGWAYFLSEKGFKIGKGLSYIKGATVITTMNTPWIYYKFVVKKSYNFLINKNFLKLCGIKKVKFFAFTGVKNSSKKRREGFLKKIEKNAIGLALK